MGILWQVMNSLWWRVVMSFVAGSFSCPQAKAESFFEALFGLGSSKPKAERDVAKSGVRMGTRPQNFSDWKAERFQSTPKDGDRDPAYGGSYKTVCVRTCDGYYWPISRSVTSGRFESDAQRCDAGCLGEAKLFYQHKDSDDPKTMVDREGNSYTSLKNAFLYRKTLLNGCGCRAAPWSMAEQVRHQEYRVAEDAKQLQLAMQREREKAETLRKDKIAQIIAATREAVTLDEAEASVFGDAVAAVPVEDVDVVPDDTIAAVDVETNPDVSVTGYVHLHVLPDSAVDVEIADAEPSKALENDAAVKTALLETSGASAEKAEAPRRKLRAKTSRIKPAKPVQTVSLFGGLSDLFSLGAPSKPAP